MEKDDQTRIFQMDHYRKDSFSLVYPPAEDGQESRFVGQDAEVILAREDIRCIRFQSKKWQRVADMEEVNVVDTWLVRNIPTNEFSNVTAKQQSEEGPYALLARRLEESSGITGLTVIAV